MCALKPSAFSVLFYKSSHAHPNLGKEKQVIGYEASEVLDIEPAKYFVQVTKRENEPAMDAKKAGSVAHRSRIGSSRKVLEVTEW
jgi:hypothetical protein